MIPARRLLVIGLPLLLAACAHPPRPWAGDLPLCLSPASLGRELALQQRMTVTAQGRALQFDVALEVDADAVRLVVLAFGQTLARLDWDGRELKETRARGWPPVVTGAMVLRDLQLVHWPAAAIREALPWGWSLHDDAQARELRLEGRPVIRVRHPSPGSAELDNLAAGYTLRLESRSRPAAPNAHGTAALRAEVIQ
jgi:hypothetical protein